ncbi:MAG: alpha/beta hydrolase [Alcanivoracaceae bacterium]
MHHSQRQLHPAPASRGQRLLAASFRVTLKALMKPLFHPRTPTGLLRAGMRTLTTTTLHAAGVRFQPIQMGTVSAEAASPATAGKQAILYLHGGAYCVGSPATHRAITSHLARRAEATVFAVDYRLAPEHPFPAAPDDALTAYGWLLDNGYQGRDIFIAGDSAGGGLALATALQIRDHNMPSPGGMMLLSPWVDLTLTDREAAEQRDEVMLTWSMLDHSARHYVGEQRAHPLASPLFADLAGLSPVLIIVGTDEILLGDAERLFERMTKAGTHCHLSVYQDMWHVFPVQAGALRTANQAIDQMAWWMSGP